jgi:uncharacterized delta-60 repeat protein
VFVAASDTDLALARFTPAGTLDLTFGVGGGVTTALSTNRDRIHAVALQGDGKIVVAGVGDHGGNTAFAVARYEINGTLDAGFGSGGVVMTDYGPGFEQLSDVVIQPDGAIVVVGLSGELDYDAVVLRYESDGDLDATFGTGGIAELPFPSLTAQAFGVVLQPDGKILVSGHGSYAFALARFDSAGTLDATFGDGGSRAYPGLGPVGIAYDLVVQPNGSIVLGGSIDSLPERDLGLVRVLPNGRLDPSFGGDGLVTLDINGRDNYGQAVVLQSDGKIAIAGAAELAANDYRAAFARYLGVGPCDSGSPPDTDGDFACDAADPCSNVAGARDFVADPAPSLDVSHDFQQANVDKLKLMATFDLPLGGFASFDPIAGGARVIIYGADTSEVVDAVLPAGAFMGAGTAGWKSNGAGNRWKFVDRTGSPVAGIGRMDVKDLSKKSPDRVAVKVLGKRGNYFVSPALYPLAATVVLGDATSSAAGLCGEGGGFVQ